MILLTILTKASFALAVCRDGTISYSSGRGTCSWHGGIAFYTTQEALDKLHFSNRTEGHKKRILELTLEYSTEQEKCWNDVYMKDHNYTDYEKCTAGLDRIADVRLKLEEEVCDISQSYFNFETDHSQTIYRNMLHHVKTNKLAHESRLHQSSNDTISLDLEDYTVSGMGYSLIEGKVVLLTGTIAHEYDFLPVNDYVFSELKQSKYFVVHFMGEVDLGKKIDHKIEGINSLNYAVPAYKVTYKYGDKIKHETIVLTEQSFYENYRACFHYKDL